METKGRHLSMPTLQDINKTRCPLNNWPLNQLRNVHGSQNKGGLVALGASWSGNALPTGRLIDKIKI